MMEDKRRTTIDGRIVVRGWMSAIFIGYNPLANPKSEIRKSERNLKSEI